MLTTMLMLHKNTHLDATWKTKIWWTEPLRLMVHKQKWKTPKATTIYSDLSAVQQTWPIIHNSDLRAGKNTCPKSRIEGNDKYIHTQHFDGFDSQRQYTQTKRITKHTNATYSDLSASELDFAAGTMTRQDRTGQDRKGQDRTGQDRTGQDRTGQDRTGQDRTRQDRTGQDRTGQDRCPYGGPMSLWGPSLWGPHVPMGALMSLWGPHVPMGAPVYFRYFTSVTLLP